MPNWAEQFQYNGANVTWKRYDVTTSQGNILGLVRITGNFDNTPPPTRKGPILLTASAKFDGLVFLRREDPLLPMVPV